MIFSHVFYQQHSSTDSRCNTSGRGLTLTLPVHSLLWQSLFASVHPSSLCFLGSEFLGGHLYVHLYVLCMCVCCLWWACFGPIFLKDLTPLIRPAKTTPVTKMSRAKFRVSLWGKKNPIHFPFVSVAGASGCTWMRFVRILLLSPSACDWKLQGVSSSYLTVGLNATWLGTQSGSVNIRPLKK